MRAGSNRSTWIPAMNMQQPKGNASVIFYCGVAKVSERGTDRLHYTMNLRTQQLQREDPMKET